MSHDADDQSHAHPSQARVPQPWSDAARAEAAHAAREDSHSGEMVRRRKVERFTGHLVDIVQRDIEDARDIDVLLTLILNMAWGPLMFAGAVVIRRLTGAPTWSVRELAAGLSSSVIIGLVLAKLWGKRDESGSPLLTDDPPDPYGPAQEEVGFPKLLRRRLPQDTIPKSDIRGN